MYFEILLSFPVLSAFELTAQVNVSFVVRSILGVISIHEEYVEFDVY